MNRELNLEYKLEVNNVTKAFGNTKALDNISINLKKGELVSILGVSGAGKSTLFNIISGLLTPDEGSVILDGRDITGETGNVSYMLQKDMLLPYRTIEDNLALPLILKGVKKEDARAEANKHLKDFGLEGLGKKWPSQLSGGMRQRAALLRTYLFSDNVALLDEPFSALDSLTKAKMHSWYLSLMEKIELSTLFITHDIEEAILLSDRIYLLTGKPGRIMEEIVIDAPRPRTNQFTLTEEFLNYKKRIISML